MKLSSEEQDYIHHLIEFAESEWDLFCEFSEGYDSYSESEIVELNKSLRGKL